MLRKELCPMKRASDNSPYPLEFKAEAVRLFHESGKSLREVADDLGVSTNSLREWVKRSDIATGARPGLDSDERAELNKLRRENRILREEREILKKAAVFFGEETKSRK
jgi:transposase